MDPVNGRFGAAVVELELIQSFCLVVARWCCGSMVWVIAVEMFQDWRSGRGCIGMDLEALYVR